MKFSVPVLVRLSIHATKFHRCSSASCAGGRSVSRKTTTSVPTEDPDEPRKGLKAYSASQPPHIWLTPSQMEVRYGRSKSYWYDHRREGTGPPFTPFGTRTILYRLDQVDAWIAELEVKGFSDPKYIELRRARAARRAKAKRTASKVTKVHKESPSFGLAGLRLRQLRSGATAPQIGRFHKQESSRRDSGLRPSGQVAQAAIKTLCPWIQPLPVDCIARVFRR